MSQPIPLHFENADVRMVMRDGEPWWVLRDLCKVLRIKNHRDAATRLWGWQKDGVGIPDAIGRQQWTIIVNEAGAYALILDSKRPEAETLARWLFTEIIPSIRKHGCYPPPPEIELALPAPEPLKPRETSPSERFLEECERIFGVESPRALDKRLSHIVSKNRLAQIRMGNGTFAALEFNKTWHILAGAGFDLKYILHGRRTMTGEERALLDMMRGMPDQQRALALHNCAAEAQRLLEIAPWALPED